MSKKCEHEWIYQSAFGVTECVGYGMDAVEVEYGVAEYYCPKCDETKEEEIDEESEE